MPCTSVSHQEHRPIARLSEWLVLATLEDHSISMSLANIGSGYTKIDVSVESRTSWQYVDDCFHGFWTEYQS
jgi:hypothetical protein